MTAGRDARDDPGDDLLDKLSDKLEVIFRHDDTHWRWMARSLIEAGWRPPSDAPRVGADPHILANDLRRWIDDLAGNHAYARLKIDLHNAAALLEWSGAARRGALMEVVKWHEAERDKHRRYEAMKDHPQAPPGKHFPHQKMADMHDDFADEIRALIDQPAPPTCVDCQTPLIDGQCPTCFQYATDKAIAAARREALEECAALRCSDCRDGAPSRNRGDKWVHEFRDEQWNCEASDIRALIDQPAPARAHTLDGDQAEPLKR